MSSFPLHVAGARQLGALFDHGFALAYGGRLGPRYVPPAARPDVVALDRDGGLGSWPSGFAAADRRAPSGGNVGGGLLPASPKLRQVCGVIVHHIDDYIARARLKSASGE
jgi:hypothetical protein